MSNITITNKCPCGICSRPVKKGMISLYVVVTAFIGFTTNVMDYPLTIIVFYNQVRRYGIVNTVLLPYFLFPLLMILNYIAL